MRGAIRSVGSDGMKSLMERWMRDFTRLQPGVYRPITFDDSVLQGGFEDIVHVHLGHGLMQKASRILRALPKDKILYKGSEGEDLDF